MLIYYTYINYALARRQELHHHDHSLPQLVVQQYRIGSRCELAESQTGATYLVLM